MTPYFTDFHINCAQNRKSRDCHLELELKLELDHTVYEEVTVKKRS